MQVEENWQIILEVHRLMMIAKISTDVYASLRFKHFRQVEAKKAIITALWLKNKMVPNENGPHKSNEIVRMSTLTKQHYAS